MLFPDQGPRVLSGRVLTFFSASHEDHENAWQRAPRRVAERDSYYTISSSIFSAQSNFLELFIFLVEQISRQYAYLQQRRGLQGPRGFPWRLSETLGSQGPPATWGQRQGGVMSLLSVPPLASCLGRSPACPPTPLANLLHGRNFLH